jgi:hypothetical protein
LKLLWDKIEVPDLQEVDLKQDDLFYSFLNEEKAKLPVENKARFAIAWKEIFKYAASLLVLGSAFWFGRNSNPVTQVADVEQNPKTVRTVEVKQETIWVAQRPIIKTIEKVVYVPVGPVLQIPQNQEVKTQIADLKSQVENLKSSQNEMLFALLGRKSASDRIQGVNTAYEMKSLPDTVLTALIKTLDSDPNANVRMAVVDAMNKFGKSASVREQMLLSLRKQNDEAVQIALIDFMVSYKERRAAPIFASIANSEYVSANLKERAEYGLKVVGE